MAASAVLAIRIISDATKAAREMQGLGKQTSTFGDKVGKASRVAKGMLVGLGAIGVAATKNASDLQQASGAVESVFGKRAAAVKGLAKSAADSVGLAQADYSNLAAVLGAQLGNLGVSQNKLVGTTKGLISTGADLSAMFGGTTKDAVEALSAALRGETDPIERYGISIKQANIKAYMAAHGMDKLRGAAAKQAKTQATLALITKQSTKANGQFARESDTMAHQQQVAMAKLKNASAAFGKALLPIVTKAAQLLAKMAGWVEKNQTTFKVLVAVVASLAAGIVALDYAMKAYRTVAAATAAAQTLLGRAALATRLQLAALKAQQVAMAAASKAAAAAQWLLNAALTANPIGLVIAAIAALVAGFILAYKKSETFRAIVQAVMKAARKAVGWVVDKIGDLVGWVKKKLPAAIRFLKKAALVYFKAITLGPRLIIKIISVLVGWVRRKAPAAWQWLKRVAVSVWHAITHPVDTLRHGISRVVGWVRNRLPAAFNTLKRAASNALDALLWPIRKITDAVQWLLDKLGSIHLPHIPGLSSVIGAFSAPAPTALAPAGGSTPARGLMAAAAPRYTATGPTGRAAGSTDGAAVVININGALDPDAVARQIQQILGRRARRIGRAA